MYVCLGSNPSLRHILNTKFIYSLYLSMRILERYLDKKDVYFSYSAFTYLTFNIFI